MAALRLEADGVFQAGIPSEGGFLWGIAWRLSTGISYYLRTGLGYGVVMRHEHIDSAFEYSPSSGTCFGTSACADSRFRGITAAFLCVS